jgi:hypothetical protein
LVFDGRGIIRGLVFDGNGIIRGFPPKTILLIIPILLL